MADTPRDSMIRNIATLGGCLRYLSLALAALCLAGCATHRVLAPATLYERLGSMPAIEALVEDFVAQVEADGRINGFFAQSNRPRLKRWLAEFLCVSTGGPCKYTGRPMGEGHRDMGITGADFTALVEDLVKSMDRLGVPAQERQELLALLGPMRADIVSR